MARRLIIIVNSEMDEIKFESMEDRIRDILEEYGIDAEIEDFATGNKIATRKGLEKLEIPNFDYNDLKNLIYKEIIQIVEPLEYKRKYKGNSHHLTQQICEKLAPFIKEKIDLAVEQKIKIKWRFKKDTDDKVQNIEG